MIAVPITLRAARARVRRAARRIAAAVRRRPRRARHVPLAVRHRLADRRLHLRHQPDHRARASAWPSTTACSSSPATGRSCATGAPSSRPSSGPSRRPARRSPSARSPSPCRCRRCSCSRSTSCGRSPTPASPSSCWRWSPPSWRCRRLLAVDRASHRRPACLPARRAPSARRTASGTAWRRRVMRRPIPVALGVVAVLLLLGAPFLRVQFGTPDDRVLPESADSRAGLRDAARATSRATRRSRSPSSSTRHRRRCRRRADGAGDDGVRRSTASPRVRRQRHVRRRPARDAGWTGVGAMRPPSPDGSPSCRPSRWRRPRARTSSTRSAISTPAARCSSAVRPPSSSTPSRRSPIGCRWPSPSS